MTTQLTITVRVVPGAGMSAQNTPLNSGSQPYSQSIKCQISDILQLRDTYLESFVIAYLLISVLFPKIWMPKASWWSERGSSKVLVEAPACRLLELGKVPVKRQVMLSRLEADHGPQCYYQLLPQLGICLLVLILNRPENWLFLEKEKDRNKILFSMPAFFNIILCYRGCSPFFLHSEEAQRKLQWP